VVFVWFLGPHWIISWWISWNEGRNLTGSLLSLRHTGWSGIRHTLKNHGLYPYICAEICLTSFLLQQTVCLPFISRNVTAAVVCSLVLYVGCYFCYIFLFFKQMSILILQFNWSQKYSWFQASLWCKWASLFWEVMQHRLVVLLGLLDPWRWCQ